MGGRPVLANQTRSWSTHESVPGVVGRWPFATMPPGVRALLLAYKDRKVA